MLVSKCIVLEYMVRGVDVEIFDSVSAVHHDIENRREVGAGSSNDIAVG